jgi:uncharacterized protein YxeA
MKLKVLIALLVVAMVSGLAFLVVQHSKQYQNKNVVALQERDQKITTLTKQLSNEQAKNGRVVKAYDALLVECGKGLAAHGTLSTLAKSKVQTPAPVCGPAVIQ